METLIRYTKDEATGEFIPFLVESNFQDDYLEYDGGEVRFSFSRILVGQVLESDYFGYQYNCEYTVKEQGDFHHHSVTIISRKYATLDEAETALWADLTNKARYEFVLNRVTDGEQTLESLGLFLDE